jgi:hypothetical protein
MQMQNDRETPAMLAVAIDELSRHHDDGNDTVGLQKIEGAGCVLISRPKEENNICNTVYIRGVGLAGPDYAENAIRDALEDVDAAQIGAIFCSLDGSEAMRVLFSAGIERVWGPKKEAPPVIDCTLFLGYGEAVSSMNALILGVQTLSCGIPKDVQLCGKQRLVNLSHIIVFSVSPINTAAAILLGR